MASYQDIAAEAKRRTEELGHEHSGFGSGVVNLPVVGGPIGYAINGPKKVDSTPVKDAGEQAKDLENALAAERDRARFAALNPGSTTTQIGAPGGFGTFTKTTTKGPVNTSFQAGAPVIQNPGISTEFVDPLRKAQLDQLEALKAAAAGTVPSAAEIQARDAASKAASQQFGLAAALQGGMSAGGALRQASEGAARVQGEANTQGAILRAQEQARARDSLTQALAGQRGQEQQLAQAQADVKLQTDMSNQRSKLTAMGLDANAINAMLQAQLQAMGYSIQAAAAIVQANAANVAAENSRNAAILNTGGQILAMNSRGNQGGGGNIQYGANQSPILD